VDVLAHSIRDVPVDAEMIAALKSHGVYYIPTLNVDESFFLLAEQPEVMRDEFFVHAVSPEVLQMFQSQAFRDKVKANPTLSTAPKPKPACAAAQGNLKPRQAAGVQVAFGTGSAALPERIPGWGEHHELELMVRAGLSPMDAIVAATQKSAAAIKATDRGTLEP